MTEAPLAAIGASIPRTPTILESPGVVIASAPLALYVPRIALMSCTVSRTRASRPA